MAKRKHELSILPIHDNAYKSALSSLELRDNLQKTCQEVAETFQVDHCGLALFDSESTQGKVVAEYPEWDLLGSEIYFKNILEQEKLTKTKKPLIMVDLSKHTTLEPVSSFLFQHNINFVVFFPIRHNKKTLGFFSLSTTKGPRKFTAEEINVFRLLSEKATSAIEVALLSSYVVKTSKHLDELVSSSLDAVILIDKDKHITTFNKQAEEMFGYAAVEILGEATACLHSDLDEARNIWKAVSDEGKIVRRKVTLLHKNGTKIPVLLSASSVKDSDGNEIGQAGIMQSRLIEERLFSLIQATQAVSCSLKLDDVLQCIIESAITAFPTAEKGVIHLYDKETNRLIVRANKGYSPEVAKAVSFKIGEGRAGWVFENGRPLVIDNIPKNEEFQNINFTFNHPEVNGQKSTICVPLNRKGKIIGTISLDNLSVYNAFTTEDIDLLSTFADQVTIAIENAQLFEQIQRDLHIANNFYEISSKLYPTYDPNESLKLIATHVKEVMGALSVSITALDTAGRPYEKAQNGYQEEQRVVRTGGLSTIVMRTGNPYVIPDVTKTTVSINPGMIKSGVKAAICLPLQSQGKNVGVMWVTYAKPHDFTDTEIKLLGLLANHAGAFVETAHLFQERQLLLETSKIILAAQNLDECLQTLAELMIKSLSATTFCYISILDDTNKKLTTRAAYSVTKNINWNPEIGRQYLLEDSSEEAITINTGQIQVLQKEKMPKRIKNLEQITQFQDDLKSAVLIPLSIGGNVFGVITMGERRDWKRGSFTLERVGLYEAMAGQVAAFIARMRLQEQSERDFAQLQRLYDASTKIGSTLDPDQTLHFIVEKACEAIDGWRAAAILLDEQKRPQQIALTGFDKELNTFTSIRPNGISMKVQRSGSPVVIEDISKTIEEVNPAMLHDGVQAAICLPLRLGEENIGILWLHFKQPHRFLPFQVEALKLYASQASIAYDNARKMRELEHMHQAAKVVAHVTILGDKSITLSSVAQGTKDAIGCDVVVLFELDYKTDKLAHPPVMVGVYDTDKASRDGEVAPGSIVYEMLQRDEPYIVEKISEDGIFKNKRFARDEKIVSCLAIPLKVEEHKVGVMFVNYRSYHRLSDEELTNIELFANQAAVAIRNAHLHDEIQKRVEALKALYDAGRAITGSLTLDNTLSQITEQALHIVGANQQPDGCFSHIALLEGNKLIFVATSPKEKINVLQKKAKIELNVSKKIGIMGRAVTTRLSQYVGDVHNSQEKDFIETDNHIRSQLSVPLCLGEEVIGVLSIESPVVNGFTQEDLKNVELLAAHATIAIQNAKQFDELTKTKTSLAAKTAIAWIGMASSTWGHRVEKTALTIREELELIRLDLMDSLNVDSLTTRLDKIERLANKILDRPITPPLSEEEGAQSIPINEFIMDRVDSLQQHSEYQTILFEYKFNIDDSSTIRVSLEWLRRALDIVLENAEQATRGLDERRILIENWELQGRAHIAIIDNGIGIPDHIIGSLFQKPIGKNNEEKGWGMGLLFAQMIVQTYSGDIQCAKTGPTGTTIIISLPLEIGKQ